MDRKIEKTRGDKVRKWWMPVAATAVVATAVAWAVWGNHSNTLRVEKEMLTISEVQQNKFKDYVRTSGQVMPIEVVQIAPEEGGLVVEKVVEEGARVRKGDVIVRLQNAGLELQILNAEAELAEKQNLLRNTRVAMEQDRLNNLTEQAQLDIDVERKRRNYEQNKRLFEEKLISREQYTQSEEDYELANRKRKLITSRLRQDSIYRSVQIDQMEDNLANMQRNVLLVRQRKDNMEVRSAIDGELGLLDVELGQRLTAGQMIGQINDLRDYKVQAQVDEHYIDRFRPGLTANFERGGKPYQMTIRKVYPEVRQGKFRVDFIFGRTRPEKLRSGQTFYLNVELGQSEQAILIPRGAFFQVTGGQWIFVLSKDGTKAYRRKIRIGRQNPRYYEVTEGLEPGERVITSGYEAYKDYEILEIK